MKEIQLTKGYVALVDDEDFEMVSQFKWQAQVCENTTYAIRSIKKDDGSTSTQRMHRFIMGVTDPNVQVDHRCQNGLDNQKHNLRIATQSQNNKNRRVSKNNTSGYKGVHFDRKMGKFRATYRFSGKSISAGHFDCPMEAARHYNQCARDNGEGFELLNDVEPIFPTIEHITLRAKQANDTRERTKKYLQELANGFYTVKYHGVTFDRNSGKWRVILKKKQIGAYITQSEAISARDSEINKQNGNTVRNYKDKLRS